MGGGPGRDRTRPADKGADAAAQRKREQARQVEQARREQAERKRVAHPRDGVGFGFDQDQPAAGEMDRWYKGLSKEQRDALKNSATEVTITATASRVGKPGYNLGLTERRAGNVGKILRERYGVSATIKSEPLGEEPAEWRGAPDRRDDHSDRVAVISIQPKGDKPSKPKDKPKTFDEALQKAKEVLGRNRPKDARVAKRLDGLVKKLSDARADDAYIPGRIVFHQDQPHLRPPLENVTEHARPKLQRLMSAPHLVHEGRGKYRRVPPSDAVLLNRLKGLDADIASGPQMVARQKGIQGITASKWLESVNDWMAERQRRPNSILSVYAERI
jgi:outer membrane protein OmpA-like peptidoglycan-associated protein